jgi:hypothetical protein
MAIAQNMAIAQTLDFRYKTATAAAQGL